MNYILNTFNITISIGITFDRKQTDGKSRVLTVGKNQ
jgi:hypothetical protein